MSTAKLPESVLYISGSPGSKGHSYRIENSISALAIAGVKARWCAVDDTAATSAVSWADLIVFFRVEWSEQVADILTQSRLHAVPVAFDIDDLLFDKKIMDPLYFDYLRICGDRAIGQWQGKAELYCKTLLQANFALFSTEGLRRQAAALGKKSFLVANGLNEERICRALQVMKEEKPSASDRVVRIGYASGTPTHQHDFQTVVQPLVRIMSRYQQVRLVVVGHLDLDEFPVLKPFLHRLELRPLVPLNRLPDELYRFDINIAPLEIGNPFCEAKSELKYFEAALVAVPTVASATEPMLSAICHGRAGYCAHTEADWYEALTALVCSVGLREKMGLLAREHVLKRYGVAAQCTALCTIFRQVFSDNESLET